MTTVVLFNRCAFSKQCSRHTNIKLKQSKWYIYNIHNNIQKQNTKVHVVVMLSCRIIEIATLK